MSQRLAWLLPVLLAVPAAADEPYQLGPDSQRHEGVPEGTVTMKHWTSKFEYGVGGHNGKHGGAILPGSLRWLWRDYKPAAKAVK